MSRYGDRYGDSRGYGYGGGRYGGGGGGGGGGYGGHGGYSSRYSGGPDADVYAREGGGAGHLARIHGTEEDRVNCPFYFKIGACRHGDGCSRMHNKPVFSQTVLVKHMYDNPILRKDPMAQFQLLAQQKGYNDQPDDEEFEDFYMDVFEELSKYGEIEEVVVCDNICEHLVGNVYIKFYDEEDAAECQKGLNGRFFAGRKLACEFSPVTDFREARCRQYHDNHCSRNGECNFIHTKRISHRLVGDLVRLQKYAGKRSRPESYARSSRSRRKHRSRSRSRSHSKKRRKSDKDKKRGKSRSRSKSRSESGSGSSGSGSSSSDSESDRDRHRSKKRRGRERSRSRSKERRKDNGRRDKRDEK